MSKEVERHGIQFDGCQGPKKTKIACYGQRPCSCGQSAHRTLWKVNLVDAINPKVTWRTRIILNYFQYEFEGICQIVLENFNIDQLYKSASSTQRHQKQRIWGWIIIFMKLKSFRLSYKYQGLVFPGRWLPTWFMCTWSSLAKDLAAQSGWKNMLKLHLLWAILWPLGFAYFSLHKFFQMFMYVMLFYLQFSTTLCTQHRLQ